MSELVLTEVPLIILDDDAARANMIARAVHELRKDAFDVVVAKGAQTVLHVVESGPVVLFMAARAAWGEVSALELAAALVKGHHNLHVVFVDGEPTAAYEVYGIRHVALLSSSPEKSQVEKAVRLVEEELERWAGRPLMIRSRSSERIVAPHLISYVESNRRILAIHVGDEVIRTYGKLSELQSLMPRSFFQCHKSFLVNLGMVERLERENVVLAGGAEVPVSQKRRRLTHDALAEYVARTM